MIIPSKTFAQEASKLAAEVRAAMPRQYARGGVVRGPRTYVERDKPELLLNSRGEPVDTRRLGHVRTKRAEQARARECGQVAPFLGETPLDAARNLEKLLGWCPHVEAEPVKLITGEVVGGVCPVCWMAVSASFMGSSWRP